jgi:hypothetical protein
MTYNNWPALIALETSEPLGDAGGELVEREVGVVVLRRPAGVVEIWSDGEWPDMEGELGGSADAEDRLPVQGAEAIDRKALGAGERIPDLVAAFAPGDERELQSEPQPDMPMRPPLAQCGHAPAIDGGRPLGDGQASGDERQILIHQARGGIADTPPLPDGVETDAEARG